MTAVALKKAKNTKEKPEILFGDDVNSMRVSVKNYLQDDDFGCKVECPTTFGDLENKLISRSFDGLMFDNSLDKWELGSLNSKEIETGYDIAKFCQKINPMIPICVYTTKKEIPNDSSIIVIDKSHSNIQHTQIVKEFESFTKPVHKAHNFFEKIQPKKIKETWESEINKYRLFLKIFNRWLDFGFEKLQNPYWVALLDRKIEMYGISSPKNNYTPVKIEDIEIKENYPTLSELSHLSVDSKHKPLVFWNSRNEEIINKQFKSAGPNLEKIPKYLREYFSICMIPTCINAYFKDQEETAIERAKSFSFSGQLEFVRNIFKKIYSSSKREKFKRQCEEAMLPIVVSVFTGRIDEITKGKRANKTAWVILEKIHSSKDKINEPFDYTLLSKSGVKYENSLFEYTVYKRESHSISFSITPDYDIWSEF